MKLKLKAAASHHTADFKVLAAEYRFAADGLEMLTPEIKSVLLETGKKLNEKEVGEMIKAIDACKDKKGLDFIMAVFEEFQKSPMLKQKAEEITNSIKPESSESNTASNKTAGWLGDLGRRVDDAVWGTGPLTKVVKFLSSSGVKIGAIIITAGFLYMCFGSSILDYGLYKTSEAPAHIQEELKTLELLRNSGAISLALAFCIKILESLQNYSIQRYKIKSKIKNPEALNSWGFFIALNLRQGIMEYEIL